MILPILLLLCADSAAVGSDACIDYRLWLHVEAHLEQTGEIRDTVLDGPHLFCAADWSELRVIDVSDPSRPAVIADLPGPGGQYNPSIAMDDGLVCTARGGFLRTFDAAVPSVPVHLGTCSLSPGVARDVAVQGSLAYVACGTAGVIVVDLSDPTSPMVVATLDTPGNAVAIDVDGAMGCLIDTAAGLIVLDLTDPLAPLPAGDAACPVDAVAVVIRDTLAWVGAPEPDLTAYNLANPSIPALVGSLSLPDRTEDMALCGDRASLGSSLSVNIVDIGDPSAPAAIGAFAMIPGPRNVSSDGTRTYVGGWPAGLFVLNAAEPAGAPVLGNVAIPTARSIAAHGNLVCVGHDAPALRMVDLANPSQPSLRGEVALPGRAVDIATDGALACVAVETSALVVVDVSDPDAPAVMGSLPLPDAAAVVTMTGSGAVVIDETRRFHVVSLADPSLPVSLGSIELPFAERHLDVAVEGNLAFVGTSHWRVDVIDIGGATGPTLLGSIYTEGDVFGVVPDGDVLYVTSSNHGLQVFDISDPQDADQIAFVRTPSYPGPMVKHGRHLHVAVGTSGVFVFDVIDPSAPTWAGSVEITTLDLALAGDVVCALTYEQGLWLLPTACVASHASPLPSPAGVKAFPNPSSSGSSVRFTTARQGTVMVSIHDVRGRLISRLESRNFLPGDHDVAWDGLDSAGRPVPAGVYLARIATPDGAFTSRMAVVR